MASKPETDLTSDAAAFLHRAEVWLRQAEAENNLLLGIARALTSGDHPYRDPIYLATVEDDGKVCGCAFRTPPYKFALTRMPPERRRLPATCSASARGWRLTVRMMEITACLDTRDCATPS